MSSHAAIRRLPCALIIAIGAAMLPSSAALAASAGFGDLLVSAGGLQNRVGLYDGATGALKVGNFAWDGGLMLNGAQGLAYGANGATLYVASSNLNQIVRYNGVNGTFSDLVVASGSGGLMQPYGLILRNNDIFVASYGTNSIKHYNTSGAYLGDFVTSGLGGLLKPTSLAFGPDGQLYVASSGNDKVLKYDGATGAFVGTFIASGSGGLDRPIDVKFGSDNNLYVSSSLTNSVLKYDGATGAFVSTFVAGGGAADLQNPWGLGFNGGNLYVASRDTNLVKRFDAATGTFLGNFAQPLAPSAGFITFSTAPEPATIGLLAVGLLMLRRRR